MLCVDIPAIFGFGDLFLLIVTIRLAYSAIEPGRYASRTSMRVILDGFASSFRLSHRWLAGLSWRHYTHPLAPSAFTDITATTGCSAPWCRIRTLALVVQSTCDFSVGIDTEGSHVPPSRLARDQATYMPDTAPPVNRPRRNSSRSLLTNRGFDIILIFST